MDKLYDLVYEFRSAIVYAIRNGMIIDRLLNNFPIGCCTIASDLLQHYLMDNNINTYEVSGCDGDTDGGSHTWLETSDGIIIDITYDQYDYERPIYVGESNHFYESINKYPKIHCYNNDLDDRKMNLYSCIIKIINSN